MDGRNPRLRRGMNAVHLAPAKPTKGERTIRRRAGHQAFSGSVACSPDSSDHNDDDDDAPSVIFGSSSNQSFGHSLHRRTHLVLSPHHSLPPLFCSVPLVCAIFLLVGSISSLLLMLLREIFMWGEDRAVWAHVCPHGEVVNCAFKPAGIEEVIYGGSWVVFVVCGVEPRWVAGRPMGRVG